MDNIALIIPARYKSSRFPGKPLVNISGVPLIIRVADIGSKAVGKSNVYVATDDVRIQEKVQEYNYSVIMTSESCITGTDRVAEACQSIDAEIIINVQGDEPMLDPQDIIKAAETKMKNTDLVVACMSNISELEDPSDLKIPKVVVNCNNELLYVSRNVIPSSKDGSTRDAKKQVCIYVFTKSELEIFSANPKTPLEKKEDIEILRFLELGIPVKMVEVQSNTHAVDFIEDVEIVENLLGAN